MTTLNPFDACRIYLAIKTHFITDSYNYHKYHGKMNLTPASFETRKDKFSFIKLAKKYTYEDYEKFILANVLKSPKIYSRELLTEDADNTYRKHQKKIQALSYFFKEEMDQVIGYAQSRGIHLDTLLEPKNGEYPELLELYHSKVISIETLIILNRILEFFPIWDKKINDTVIWPMNKQAVFKYEPFLEFDLDKFKKALKEQIRGN